MQHQKKTGSTLPNFQNIQKPASTQWSLHYRQKKRTGKGNEHEAGKYHIKSKFFGPHSCENMFSGFAIADALFYFSLNQSSQMETLKRTIKIIITNLFSGPFSLD